MRISSNISRPNGVPIQSFVLVERVEAVETVVARAETIETLERVETVERVEKTEVLSSSARDAARRSAAQRVAAGTAAVPAVSAVLSAVLASAAVPAVMNPWTPERQARPQIQISCSNYCDMTGLVDADISSSTSKSTAEWWKCKVCVGALCPECRTNLRKSHTTGKKRECPLCRTPAMNLYDARGYYTRKREEVDEEGFPISGYVNGIYVGQQGHHFGEGMHSPVYYSQDYEEEESDDYHSALGSLQRFGFERR